MESSTQKTLFDFADYGFVVPVKPDAQPFDDRSKEESKTEWLTPPYIVKALGEFDLDPCSPVNTPFYIAKNTYTILDNGFTKEWFGRVFLNPPYTRETWRWMRKLAEHGNGIALIFARTETQAFFPYVWEYADAIFFFNERLFFYHVTGVEAESGAGAPSVLVAYGKDNADCLESCNLGGKFIRLK